MPKIEASKLNRSLKEVLDAVASGKRFDLTRYGKVVAKIVPASTKEPKIDPDAGDPSNWEPVEMNRQKAMRGVQQKARNLDEFSPDPLGDKVRIKKADTDLSAEANRRQKQRDFLLHGINRKSKTE